MEWVGVITTVLSFFFALWCWWHANASTTAKVEAEKATLRAEESVIAAQKSAREAERLTQEISDLKGAPIQLERLDGARYVIRNKTSRELKILSVENFGGLAREMPSTPFILPNYSEQHLDVLDAMGAVMSYLQIEIEGYPQPLQLYARRA